MSSRQSEIFDAVHDRYYASSADEYADAYNAEFKNRWFLEQLGDSRSLIEIASGEGVMAGWLRDQRPGLEIAGCDISERAVEGFKRRNQADCFLADMTKPFDIGRTFDTVLVCGGIHHLVTDLPTAFANIRNLLNDGGRLIMIEPNANYFLEPFRKFWYALDKSNFDASSEHALAHDRMFRTYGEGFTVADVTYRGGPAYYLATLNYILRIPQAAKRWLSPPAMVAERLWHKLPGRLPHAYFLACWQKTASTKQALVP
jgi:SAM-dependent methyltransferase